MEDTIQKAAAIAGLSARTLRYYDEIGLNLSQIEQIIKNPSFDRMEALREHLRLLTAEQSRLSRLIATVVKKTIQEMKGEQTMRDEEKFEGFKRELIEKTKKYGREIREKFGEEAVTNGAAPDGPAGKEIAALHRQWLSFPWTEYSPTPTWDWRGPMRTTAASPCTMDKNVPGCAIFLRDAIEAYLPV